MRYDNLTDYDNNDKALKSELLHSIENAEFYTRVQPVISTKTQTIVGGEILSRWLNLKFDEVMPNIFMPHIRTLGLSKKFDLNVLNKTIEILETQVQPNHNIFIDVNFSAEQFSDPNFIRILKDLLEVKPWINKYIVIEILESTMMVNIDITSRHLKAIRELGFKIAIDDFGTGFSSLSYLKHFAIDYLKIDKSFIDNIEDNKKDIEILKTIVTLASAIDAKVILEGVERESQYNIAKELEIDYIQGFYFYKPLLPNLFFSQLHNTSK